MKKILAIAALAATTLAISCKKDEGKLPAISFKTGAGYTSSDATVGPNDTVLVGINAHKTEDKDVLKTFDAAQSFDGGASSTFINESLSGSNGDNYSRDIQIITRDTVGTERYTFTVINRDGLKNAVNLTLTVQ